jgi:hypothetical protein
VREQSGAQRIPPGEHLGQNDQGGRENGLVEHGAGALERGARRLPAGLDEPPTQKTQPVELLDFLEEGVLRLMIDGPGEGEVTSRLRRAAHEADDPIRKSLSTQVRSYKSNPGNFEALALHWVSTFGRSGILPLP